MARARSTSCGKAQPPDESLLTSPYLGLQVRLREVDKLRKALHEAKTRISRMLSLEQGAVQAMSAVLADSHIHLDPNTATFGAAIERTLAAMRAMQQEANEMRALLDANAHEVLTTLGFDAALVEKMRAVLESYRFLKEQADEMRNSCDAALAEVRSQRES